MPKTIVVDPGHGGDDPGAVGQNLKEKDLNLKIGRRIVTELLRYRCNARLTRKSDTNPGLNDRATLANSLNADLFVSVHINSGGGTGFESYIYRAASDSTVKYRDTVHSKVAGYLSGYGMADRGRKKAGFAVLRLTAMPAMLLENLFIDNSLDASLLRNETFMAGLAYTITLGIADALALPLKEDPWDPAWEIEQLMKDGIINASREAGAQVYWGETATVFNRMRGTPPPSAGWDPEGELGLLIRDKIINTPRKPGDGLLWGEFATALNRLREREVSPKAWDPAAEIRALIDDRLLFATRNINDKVLWGEFATVLNRYRGVGG